MATSGQFQCALNHNYKSTPEMKNHHLKIGNEENTGRIVRDNFYSTKINDKRNVLVMNDISSNSSNIHSITSPNKKSTPKSINTKNAHVNLWRKPVVVGSIIGNAGITNAEPTGKSNSKTKMSKQNTVNNIQNAKISNFYNSNLTNTNILSTNHTDHKREEIKEFTVDVNYKNASPIQHYIETPKNKDNIKFGANYDYAKKNSDKGVTSGAGRSLGSVNQYSKRNSEEKAAENIVEKSKIEKNATNNPVKPNKNNIHINYLTNYNTNINITNNDNIQSEILSSILNFKTLLKANESTNNIDKLMKSEENLNIINQLNSKLNMYGGGFGGVGGVKSNETKENENTLKKEPKQDYNKMNINVINADMLGDDIFVKPKETGKEQPKETKVKEIETVVTNKTNNSKKADTKDKMINEIYTNSDMRMKRYEILLDFISSNLKEINHIMNNSQITIQPNINNEASRENHRDMYKVESSNKLSSLHSRINLNSRTNINLDKDLDDDNCDPSGINERLNMIGQPKEETQLNLNDMVKNNKNLYEPSPSFLISSINSDFYQHLLEESFHNFGNNNNYNHNILNISNDMSSFRTPNDQIRRLERLMSNEIDKTTLQYLNKHSSDKNPLPTPSFGPSHTFTHRTSAKDKIHANQGDDDDLNYNEGEENLEESELDKTKENIQTLDPRKFTNNQVMKDLERVKFFSHNQNHPKNIDTNFTAEVKDKTSKSPEEKSSKCIIF